MMDFLRRLAPQRATDAARAVAVLPSRFASESPLQASIGQARPALRPDDTEASLSFDASLPLAAGNAFAEQRHPFTSAQPSQAAPRQTDIEPMPRQNRRETSSTQSPGEAPDIDIADPSAFQHRATPAGSDLKGLAATHSLQAVAAPLSQPHSESPLSQAILAQRTPQPRDDNQVVQVTIGRIDVVASTAPAPAQRRGPTPRQPTVSLADYLRGGNGGRR